LTIRKKGTIVAHKNFVKHGTDDVVINHRLIRLGAEYEIKRIGPERRESDNTQARYGSGHLYRDIFALGAIRGNNDGGIVVDFALRTTPTANDHLDIRLNIVVCFRILQGCKSWCGFADGLFIG
jgi:hypothetical protein